MTDTPTQSAEQSEGERPVERKVVNWDGGCEVVVREADYDASEANYAWLARYSDGQHARIVELEAELAAAQVREAALREALEAALIVVADHSASCKDLHHAKADQHEGHMECPVEKRIGAVEVQIRAALAPPAAAQTKEHK
jgi:hypothetical protein